MPGKGHGLIRIQSLMYNHAKSLQNCKSYFVLYTGDQRSALLKRVCIRIPKHKNGEGNHALASSLSKSMVRFPNLQVNRFVSRTVYPPGIQRKASSATALEVSHYVFTDQ